MTHPTSYRDVNTILQALLSNVQAILGDRLIGMYLHGSLAGGDFDHQRSDIDFVVVTVGELSGEELRALTAMHTRLSGGDSKWGKELEGSYIPQHALRRYDPSHAMHAHIERGGSLVVEHHHTDWVIQRHVLREKGIALVGPDPRTLVDPVQPDDLQRALVELLRGWWALQLEDTSRVRQSGYQAYTILTMCRALYTLQYGAIVSKPVAANWAQEALGERWAGLIERALTWQPETQLDALNETLGFIRYTLERARRFENPASED